MGCSESTSDDKRTLVFAAASLTACLEDLAVAYKEAEPSATLQLHFAGTPTLVAQLKEGAPAGLFLSADEPNMRRAEATGRVLGKPACFARNRIAILVPRGNPKGLRGLKDLARADLLVALCGQDVPAGRYARLAIEAAGHAVKSVSDEPNVNALLQKLRLGEIDATIAFKTDALRAQDAVEAIDIAGAERIAATYWMALIEPEFSGSAARGFFEFLQSTSGQAILARHGFLPP